MKTILNRHYGGMICILMGVSMGGGGGVNAASTANLTNLANALAEFCVPKCTSGCSEMLLADYKVPAGSSVGTCVCKSTNLQYDPASRECIVHCPIGTYAYASHEACPAGTYAHNGACPKGSYGSAGACSTVGKYKFSIE